MQNAANATHPELGLGRFKSINDNYGHAAEDGNSQGARRSDPAQGHKEDCFGGIGGQEFLLRLVGMDMNVSGQFLERIRRCIEALPISAGTNMPAVTISAGIANPGAASAADTPSAVPTTRPVWRQSSRTASH